MLINNFIYKICIQVFMCMKIIISNQYLGMVMNENIQGPHPDILSVSIMRATITACLTLAMGLILFK